MKESYGEGVASHIGPESCGGDSNGAAEALTGERAGRVWSRENPKSRVPTLLNGWKATRSGSIAQDPLRPCAVRDPEHVRKHSTREPGEPISAFGREGPGGCIVKSKDARR
jgi:hypothetical protein